jgi:hypothetical protein
LVTNNIRQQPLSESDDHICLFCFESGQQGSRSFLDFFKNNFHPFLEKKTLFDAQLEGQVEMFCSEASEENRREREDGGIYQARPQTESWVATLLTRRNVTALLEQPRSNSTPTV